MHSTPAELTHIAAPADAQHVEPWVDENGDGTTWGRYVRGTRRSTTGLEIVVAGWQSADGTVERHAFASATDVALNAAALRRLAAVALNAAEELDRLDEGADQ